MGTEIRSTAFRTTIMDKDGGVHHIVDNHLFVRGDLVDADLKEWFPDAYELLSIAPIEESAARRRRASNDS